jgi:hypothetical protein
MAFDPKAYSSGFDPKAYSTGFNPKAYATADEDEAAPKPVEILPTQPFRDRASGLSLSDLVTGAQPPKPPSGLGTAALDAATEVGPAMAGQAIGAFPALSIPTFGASVPIGGAIGGLVGNVGKQYFQKQRGDRNSYSLGEAASATALGAINLKGAGAGSTLAKKALVGGLQGAGMGGASKMVETALDHERFPTFTEFAGATAGGAGMGGVMAGIGASIGAAMSKKPPASIQKVMEIFQPPPGESRMAAIKELPHTLQADLVNKFAPLKRLEDKVFKESGSSRLGIDLSRKFEQIAGAPGKAEANIIRFDDAVSKHVFGDEPLFNSYLFLKRAENRVGRGLKTGDYTPDTVNQALADLSTHIGPDKLKKFEEVSIEYQKHMDDVLHLQVQSGRMSQKLYDDIKASNDFYAPYRVLSKLTELEKVAATGNKRIDTSAELTKAITGVDQEDLKLDDILMASRENIFKSEILAAKNEKMLEVDGLAQWDPDGKFVKRVGDWEEAPADKAKVFVFKDGQRAGLLVDHDVAKAIQGMNSTQVGLFGKSLAVAGKPFRAGATTANASFQVVNAVFADAPRLGIMSKYGLGEGGTVSNRLFETVKFPLDYAYALSTSLKGNFGKPNDLYMQWLDSGAARSTVQDSIAQMGRKGIVESTALQRKQGVLESMGNFANAIEETAKIAGLKRGLRMEGFEKASPANQKRIMERVVAEVRNYAGSPDFGRGGSETVNANLLFMFFNARIQGAASDLGRTLLGADGWKRSAITMAKSGALLGTPTIALWYRNQQAENADDYSRIPKAERDNYWMILRNNSDGSPKYFKNDNGEMVRDSWRVPKREWAKTFSNSIESFLTFTKEKDPASLKDFGVSFLENISPISVSGDNWEQRIQSVISSTNPLIKAPIQMGLGVNTFFHRDTIPQRLKGGIGGVDPELQFTESTPTMFRKAAEAMPDFLAERFRSPLYLEQLTQDLSAGLITQFVSGKKLEGRDDMSNWPVVKRFVRSQHIDTSKETNRIKELDRESTNVRLRQKNQANDLFDAIRTLPEDKRGGALVKVAEADPTILEPLVNEATSRTMNWTPLEKQIGLLGVEDGQRAVYISEQVLKLKPEERAPYIQNLVGKKLINDQVALQVARRVGANR